MNGPPGDYPPGEILNDTQSLRMGEASSGLHKKSAVGWDGWFSILQVKWIVYKEKQMSL